MTNRYEGGKFDGRVSARLRADMHDRWVKDADGKLTHHDPEYMLGYIEGYMQVAGMVPPSIAGVQA